MANIEDKKLRENCIIVELETGETWKGKLNLSEDTIDYCATTLAKRMVDFGRNGGDIKNMTPKDIYGKKKKQDTE